MDLNSSSSAEEDGMELSPLAWPRSRMQEMLSATNIQRYWRATRRINRRIDMRRILRMGPLGNIPINVMAIIWKWVAKLETILRPPAITYRRNWGMPQLRRRGAYIITTDTYTGNQANLIGWGSLQ